MHLTHVIFLFFGVCKLTSAAIPIPKVPVDADPDIGAADTSLAHDTPPEPVDPVPPGEETSGEGTVGPEIEPTLAMSKHDFVPVSFVFSLSNRSLRVVSLLTWKFDSCH